VTVEEKDIYAGIKDRLKSLLEYQITNFRYYCIKVQEFHIKCLEITVLFNALIRYCFPFGRPEGSLKATLSLLERVLMKDILTPAPPEEVRGVIKKCLESAALVNYTRISEAARIEG
jgi:hypothetical protein